MTPRGRIWRITLTCPQCGEAFIRYAAGIIEWNGQGGQGWYYDVQQASWCGACRVGWGDQKGGAA